MRHGLHPFIGRLLVLALSLVPSGLFAQTVRADLEALGAANADLYVEPLTRGVTLAMGGGTFDGARVLDGPGLDVGLRVAGALPPSDADRFAVVLPEMVTWESGPYGGTFENPYRTQDGTGTSPTVAGEGPGAVLVPNGEFRSALVASGEDPEDYRIHLPRGHDTPVVPYPVFHASVGIGLGTEVTARFLPRVEVDSEIGDLQAFGFGARHMITRWFDSPVDISVLASRQTLELAEYADATATQYGVVAGRNMGPLSLFATGIVRRGTVDVRYVSENPGDRNPALPPDGTEIRFSEELEARPTFGLGARLQLLILNLAAHYTFDEYSLVTLKVGLGSS